MNGELVLLWVIGICILTGFTIGIIRRNEGDSQSDQFIGWGFYGVLLAIVLGISIPFISAEKIGTQEHHYMYVYSLKNQNDTEGSFFLGSGNIDQIEYYYYFYRGKYGYDRGKLPINNVSIVETDTRKPELTQVYNIYDTTNLLLWAPNPTEQYILYVPKNTIIRQFKAY